MLTELNICESCFYWDEDKKYNTVWDEHERFGACHRYPPLCFPYENGYAITSEDGWCGEWKTNLMESDNPYESS